MTEVNPIDDAIRVYKNTVDEIKELKTIRRGASDSAVKMIDRKLKKLSIHKDQLMRFIDEKAAEDEEFQKALKESEEKADAEQR